MVAGSVATERCDDPEADTEHGRDHDREDRELERRRDELLEVVGDRLVRQRGLPQVALDEVLQIDRVANRQWLVETVVLLEGRYRSWIAGCLLPEVGRDCVARNELRENEDDERDPDPEEDEGDESTEHEPEKARRRTTPAPFSLGRFRCRNGCGRQGPPIVPLCQTTSERYARSGSVHLHAVAARIGT